MTGHVDANGSGPTAVRAWRPAVPGVSEVFHARFTDHAYPAHTHQDWTVLIIDDGAVRYDLDRREHGALSSMITLLPPQVAHDGRSAVPGGFRKRVIYLDLSVIDERLIGPSVDHPELIDPLLRHRLAQLHTTLARPGEEVQAQSRLVLITERLQDHLRHRPAESPLRRPDQPVARRLRDLLDEHLADGLDLEHAAAEIGVTTAYLIRAFTASFGLPPHRYLTGRRVERARRLLLNGMPIADAAIAAGFYDQAHLSRHLQHMINTTPGRYRRSAIGTG
ncbi:AraC family transcriptional regulator [Microlunatus sp. Gsoil 973]|uniref:AraC family transcriptional regulator n=1 Tax=Microlunatus sp. Gsoil 973 TaxID=2672569 RepID=UPI0012B4E660|nr:AraC family transcriptional regulator [Microlunatus sp. Gsoil 973]QGN31654.1 helix-turn-helix domain-containing protein [Microlunatus sp. Gsoil 973]